MKPRKKAVGGNRTRSTGSTVPYSAIKLLPLPTMLIISSLLFYLKSLRFAANNSLETFIILGIIILSNGGNIMNRDTATPKVKKIPGKKAKKQVQSHMKYAAPATYINEVVRDCEKQAIGPFFTDVDGNILLDFVSNIGASPLGYNNPEVMQLKRKLVGYDIDRYAGADFIIKADVPTASDLHHKLHEITKHLGMNMHFLSNSGAEAVENAIKICYAKQRNYGYGIAFRGAFHGRTLGALSLNRSKKVQRQWYPKIPKIEHLPYCDCFDSCECGWEFKSSQNSRVKTTCLEELLRVTDPAEIAYIIMEPIQGEGGYKIPNKDFIRTIYETASKNKIPVISDEIQSGLGRTGKWWAIEHFGLKPDVITSAKALGVGATISRKEMFPAESGRISSTWAEGNLMASAVGYTTIGVIQKQKLLENATAMGNYLVKQLKHLAANPLYSNARGIGLMDAVDVATPQIRDAVVNESLKRGLVIIGCGYKSIRFLPPLDVTKREIDIAMGILEDAGEKVLNKIDREIDAITGMR